MFINSMAKESKYCRHVMKNLFNKELVITKEDDKSSTKCWICDNAVLEGGVTVTDHCHVTGKYRSAAHRGWNINFSLNYKNPVVFHNLQNYNAHLTMQELKKLDFKISVIYKGSEKYMSFSLDKKLISIDSLQFFRVLYKIVYLKIYVKMILSICIKNLIKYLI